MKLYIVGLPIGNIEDISLRAIKTIESTKYVVCEDTRMFSNLWTKMTSLGYSKKFDGKIRFINDFNEERQLPRVLAELATEENAVLVSDAGMPLISDPGYKIVRSAIDLGWEIEVIPGPTAESAALAISGLPTDKYLFVGFLPKKEGKRKELLKNIISSQEQIQSSVVIYESAVRLEKILGDILSLSENTVHVCIAIDLTKVSEKVLRGDLNSIIEQIKGKKIRGEVTIVLNFSTRI